MGSIPVQNIGRKLRILLVVVVCGLVLAGIPSLLRGRETARKSACVNNLKQLGLALDSFAQDHGGLYPRIDTRKGNIIFNGDSMYPAHISEIDILGCPSDSGYKPGITFRLKSADDAHFGQNIPHPSSITCESYVYLGWVVTSENEGLAAISAYLELFDKKDDETVETGSEKNGSDLILTTQNIYSGLSGTVAEAHFAEDLIVAPGDGNQGTNIIHRLTEHAEIYAFPPERLNPEVRYPSIVPVVWEWPDNHSPAGGHVLYLDNHVEFVSYPGKFPMTRKFIEALRKLNANLPPGVPIVVTK